MTMEEILAGESKNVEFKESLPERSIKYMKSVVAFANGTGGKIIFGVADKTRAIVGLGKDDVFKEMDAIANAVSDSCEPAIIPDITAQTIDGKTVIVVEVSEGRQRPYYIKALAYAFSYMNLIEHWGSGIPRIIDKVKAAGLQEPEFIGGEVDLRINIYRRQVKTIDPNELNDAIKVPDTREGMPDSAEIVPDTNRKVPDTREGMPNSAEIVPDTDEKTPDNEQEQRIYKYVSENGAISTIETVELLDVKQRRARVILSNMVKDGYLRKEGAARSTTYVKNTEGK